MSAHDDPLARLVDDPVGNTVHHPYSAYCQGWDAREEGHAIQRNPYDSDTRESDWWAMGWTEAGDSGHDGEEAPDPPSTRRAKRRTLAARLPGGEP